MAFELHRVPGYPAVAASAVNYRAVVKWVGGDTERQVVAIGSGIDANEPFGVAEATAAQGAALNVYDRGHTVKVTAGASLGAGADIAVGSTNGALGVAAGASGVTHWRVGVSQTAAVAGEIFSLYVDPRQLSNLA